MSKPAPQYSTPTTPRERPILFSTDMVNAILEGRKTQTRRVINPQPEWIAEPNIPFKTHDADPEGMLNCPYGKPGDILYVRETWKPSEWSADGDNWHITYKADGPGIVTEYLFRDEEKELDFWIKLSHELNEAGCPQDEGMYLHPVDYLKWRPSIFMPKKAARIWLRIKGLRVERVKDITPQDIRFEGVKCNDEPADALIYDRWIKLWNSINAARGYPWQDNPWVWVVDLEIISTTGSPITNNN